MDDEDFLAAVEADNAGTPIADEMVTEPPKEETPPEPKAEEPKAEPETPAEPEVLELDTPATPEQVQADEANGRLMALLDTRDKLKAAEAKLAQYEQRQVQPAQRPDEYEDPDGARAFDQAQVAEALYQQRLHFSEQLASVKHGEELVAKAKEWAIQKCDADPYFNAKARSSEDPVGFAVAEYKREEIASKVNLTEYEQFQAWKAAQSQLQDTQPGAQPAQQQTSAIPSKSIASAPSAGGILTEPVQGDEEIFNEVMPQR